MKKLFYLFLIFITLNFISCDEKKIQSLLIYPFTDKTTGISEETKKNFSFLSLGIADEITEKLETSDNLILLDQEVLFKKMTLTQLLGDMEQSEKLYKQIQSLPEKPDFFLKGNFSISEETHPKTNKKVQWITMEAYVFSVKEKKEIASTKQQGPMAQWFEVRGLLTIDLAKKLNIPLTDEEKKKILAANTERFQAFQENYKGKMLFYESINEAIAKEKAKATELRNKANYYFHKARSLDEKYKNALVNWGRTYQKQNLEQVARSSKNQKAQYQLNTMVIYSFQYKTDNVYNIQAWKETYIPYLNSILENLPAGYKIEIQGHADASGPELPTGNKKGNIYWSEIRAKGVYDILVQNGLPANKFTYKGYGASRPIPWIEKRDPANRRVTFSIVSE